MIDPDEYSAKLRQVADEFIKILNSSWDSWDKVRLPLIDKAARFLIRETIIKRDLTKDAGKIFPNTEACGRFYAELCEPAAHPPLALSNMDIGRYCFTLFLVCDSVAPDPSSRNPLYGQIKAKAEEIMDFRFSIDENPPLFEDFLKTDNQNQNTKTDFICRLECYLKNIKAYLQAKKLWKPSLNERVKEWMQQNSHIIRLVSFVVMPLGVIVALIKWLVKIKPLFIYLGSYFERILR
jgi:hypothetical protein